MTLITIHTVTHNMRECAIVYQGVCVCVFQAIFYLSDFISFCFSVADGIGVYLAMGLSSQA